MVVCLCIVASKGLALFYFKNFPIPGAKAGSISKTSQKHISEWVMYSTSKIIHK